MLGPRLELKQSQQLVMTPQLQLAIKLLALTNIELEAFVAEELEKNPLLNAGDAGGGPGDADGGGPDAAAADVAAAPAPSPTDDGLDRLLGAATAEAPLDADYAGETFHHDGPTDSADWGAGPGGDGEGIDFDGFAGPEPSLAEVLETQAGAAFAGAELIVARHIIDAIDEAGYLREPLDAIAARLGIDEAAAAAVLARIQRFDPVGVGARSLSECLLIQAREADRCDPAMECLIRNLELVARGDLARLMQICGVDREDIADMVRELRRYDPKPGLRHGGEPPTPVVADVFVRRRLPGEGGDDGGKDAGDTDDGDWVVELNQATLPRLIVDRSYQAVLGRGGDKATLSFLNECVASANWLLKALDQRARTIVRVASELVRHQRGFFEAGVSQLRPLTLRDIAEAIEMHESTVSRVTSNKYLQCERGVFELRYFFTSGIQSAAGEAASALAVKDRIARLIAAEGDEILSDDRLVELLQAEGFDIARRTVAKYREALGLGSSVARRRARLLKAA